MYCSSVVQYTASYAYDMLIEYFETVPFFFYQLFTIHKIQMTIISSDIFAFTEEEYKNLRSSISLFYKLMLKSRQAFNTIK